MRQVQLRPEVAARFECTLSGGPKFDCGKWGVIDFSQLELTRAEKLVAKGFPHLKAKAAAKAQDTPAK